MNKLFAIALGIGLIIVAGVAWSFFASTKGNHLVPEGKILQVRHVNVEKDEAVMIVDFRVTNPSDRDMVVRGVELDVINAQGETVKGSIVAASSLDNVFATYPELTSRTHPPMKERDVIQPHQSVERMIGARIDAPGGTVENRKDINLRVEDITGPVLELKTK